MVNTAAACPLSLKNDDSDPGLDTSEGGIVVVTSRAIVPEVVVKTSVMVEDPVFAKAAGVDDA